MNLLYPPRPCKAMEEREKSKRLPKNLSVLLQLLISGAAAAHRLALQSACLSDGKDFSLHTRRWPGRPDRSIDRVATSHLDERHKQTQAVNTKRAGKIIASTSNSPRLWLSAQERTWRHAPRNWTILRSWQERKMKISRLKASA